MRQGRARNPGPSHDEDCTAIGDVRQKEHEDREIDGNIDSEMEVVQIGKVSEEQRYGTYKNQVRDNNPSQTEFAASVSLLDLVGCKCNP